MDSAVQIALITGAFGFLGIFAEGWRRQHKAIGETLENSREAKEQVKNSHSTNLRDDIDDLHADVRQALEILHQHGAEIGGLRTDVRQERSERLVDRSEAIEVARRLEAHRIEVAHKLELMTLQTARHLQQSSPPV